MSGQKYITLNSGYKMPQIGLGTYEEDVTSELRDSIRIALDNGYRSIDTAYMYLNEEPIGDELQDWFSKGNKREDLFVTTKLPAIANRAEDVGRFLTMSLKKLKLDYVDLYLVHHPFGIKCLDDNDPYSVDANGFTTMDFDTDHESLWKALEKEVDAGRVKSLGVSNFNSKQIERILKYAKYPPAVNQIEINCYFVQKPIVDFCHKLGIAVTAYGPLGAPWTEEGKTVSPKLLENPTVVDIGKKYGKSAGQILLRFLFQRNIIVIPKSVRPARIKSNFQIMDFNISDGDMQKLYGLDRGKEGRAFHFTTAYKGCDKHKEYPFHISF